MLESHSALTGRGYVWDLRSIAFTRKLLRYVIQQSGQIPRLLSSKPGRPLVHLTWAFGLGQGWRTGDFACSGRLSYAQGKMPKGLVAGYVGRGGAFFLFERCLGADWRVNENYSLTGFRLLDERWVLMRKSYSPFDSHTYGVATGAFVSLCVYCAMSFYVAWTLVIYIILEVTYVRFFWYLSTSYKFDLTRC